MISRKAQGLSLSFWQSALCDPEKDNKDLSGNIALLHIIAPLEAHKGIISAGSKHHKAILRAVERILELQAPNGGIYLAPIGTKNIPHRDISNAHMLYCYLAFKALLKTCCLDTRCCRLLRAAIRDIEQYFLSTAFDKKKGIFYAGGKYGDYKNGKLVRDSEKFNITPDYATDVQLLAIIAFGPAKIDKWFGRGASYDLWRAVKRYAGYYSKNSKEISGIGLVKGNNNSHMVSTLDAIIAAKALYRHYPALRNRLSCDISGIDKNLKYFETKCPGIAVSYKEALKRQRTWWGETMTAGQNKKASHRAYLYRSGIDPYMLKT